jgi:acetolactate synthase-1/3 small subunit
MARHTLSVLVENKPGVLARISGMFSRRGFNIHSLAVGPTEQDEVSRMTIVVNVETKPLEQVVKQLNKLINVLKIVELEKDASVERELLLIKVKADADTRAGIVEIADIFRSKIVDVSANALTIEATGSPDKLQALTDLLHQYGVRELVRTGLVALGRGDKAITERPLKLAERTG